MKKLIAMFCLGLAGSVFALDEYLPVAKGALEIDVAYNLMSSSATFDSAGKKTDFPNSGKIMNHVIPLQLKYGIIPGLDLELIWGFQIMGFSASTTPALDTSFNGFNQPEFALKYAMMDIGAGVFVDFVAPFNTGSLKDCFICSEPGMGLSFGAVYTKLFVPQFNLTAMASYRLNMEASDSIKAGNVISIYAKPEFRFNQFGGAYLGIQYDMNSESEWNGTGNKDEGSLMTLKPGWNATWTPAISTEINIPYTVMGKRALASWGVSANFYYTLGL